MSPERPPKTNANQTAPVGNAPISSSEFESLFERSNSEIYLGNLADQTVFWMNAAARDNLGYSSTEIRSLQPFSFLGEAAAKTITQKLPALLSGDCETLDFNTTHTRKNGTDYPVHAQLQVHRLADRSIMVAIVNDLTSENRLNEELAEARMLLDLAPDATVVANANGVIVAANSQTEQLLGYSRAELLGQAVEKLIPQALRANHVGHREAFARNPQTRGMGSELTLCALRKDGSEIPIEVSLSPIARGDQVLVAAALRDMTTRMVADEALRNSEARYRQLFENSNDLIQSFNSAGHIEFVNPAWLQAMGYSEEELPKLRFFDLVAPENSENARAIVAELEKGATLDNIELVYLTKLGERLYLEGRAEWQVEDGKRVSSSATLHNVTEHKKLALALREARDQAEQATMGKSRFLTAASHDLRQPLQALQLYLAVLERLGTTDKHHEVTDKMGRSLQTMAELLDALLDISKLDSGEVEPELHEFALHELLDGVLTHNRPQAESKGLKLQLVGRNVAVVSDSGLLARIVDNFVTNAIRYTPQGSVTVEVVPEGDNVAICVKDTGVGIPADQLGQVFEEYYQLDNHMRDRRNGLGLGLSIVKHIANLLDHSIAVESTLGEGSQFSVSVPLATTSNPVLTATDVSVPLSSEDHNTLVLFVDDDLDIVDATSMLLDSSGFEVITANSAEEAHALLDSGQLPGIIVSDYRLPGTDGLRLIQGIRSRLNGQLPAVLMTGDTNIGGIKNDLATDITFLRKPVDTTELIALIGRLTRLPNDLEPPRPGPEPA